MKSYQEKGTGINLVSENEIEAGSDEETSGDPSENGKRQLGSWDFNEVKLGIEETMSMEE